MKKRIAIFASGSDSNAQKIAEYFKNHPSIEVALIVSNKADAGVLAIAQNMGIDTYVIPSKKEFTETESLLQELYINQIDFIVLAGFLWLVPEYLVDAYPGRIVNIHPALLPKYGGKGMHGMHVHEAVVAAGEKESGITIHLVDKVYDNGEHLFQATVPIEVTDSPAIVQQKVLALEHANFAQVIEKVVNSL
ncbi:MAG: phosphoribosylglycinamide formyltransferase [Sphingobacteriales bacterium JAD_PAG50586_3]|nr:MAG: phosphoribosylglycinamide formyltransferase [Sphingobacteriales bacterium JAD_PAG50586_3]